MMGGLKTIIGLFLILALALSGCSLFLAEQPAQEDTVCVPKSKLDEMNISVEELLAEETAAEEIAEEAVEEETAEETEEEAAEEEEPAMPTKTYTAGELVALKPKATDADDDVVTFTFSEPLDENGEWQTSEGDEGEYIVTVTASDGKSEVSKEIQLVIMAANNPPVIEDIAPVTVSVGETVKLEPAVSDADGDEVTVSYSGWMNSSTKKAAAEDVGEQTVTVTASDGKAEATRTVAVTVKKVNHPPVLAELSPVRVTEGEEVAVAATATDEDGDDVTISYSEPLDSEGKWQTAEGDAGTYTATVTASDGSLEDNATVSIIVQSPNHPPVIEQDDVTWPINKGETKTFTLSPTVTDEDGDEVTVSYSGWMSSASKEVTEADAGDHIVSITADDGTTTTSLNIRVTVEVNTPPSFEI